MRLQRPVAGLTGARVGQKAPPDVRLDNLLDGDPDQVFKDPLFHQDLLSGEDVGRVGEVLCRHSGGRR